MSTNKETQTSSIPSTPSTLTKEDERIMAAQLSATTALAAIKESPTIAKAFAESLLRDPSIRGIVYRSRPKGPYYNKERAFEIKPFLDKMIDNRQPIVLYLRNFRRCNLQTLYNRVNQSQLFLAEDPEMVQLFGYTYKDFKRQTETRREEPGTPNACVAIRWIEDCKSKVEPLRAEQVAPTTGDLSTNSYKVLIDSYLEDPSRLEPLELKVSLTLEEASDLEYSLQSVEGILAHITPSKVKIIKFNSGADNTK